jgi:hypothetical protein
MEGEGVVAYTDEDLHEWPVIDLPGTTTEKWVSGYDLGRLWECQFPNQDAESLAMAMAYHPGGPLKKSSDLVRLNMAQQGYNDGPHWLWFVTLSNGEVWKADGWCDYTGWCCRSSLKWERWTRPLASLESTG